MVRDRRPTTASTASRVAIARDARDDRTAPPAPSASLRAAARQRAGRVRAARGARSTRTRSACCWATGASPTTHDAELRDGRSGARRRRSRPRCRGIELRRKSEVDYVLRHIDGAPRRRHRREPGHGGAARARARGHAFQRRSSCRTTYLQNASSVRLAVLQGLLDSDGGPVHQAGPHAAGSSTRPARAASRDDVRLPRPVARRRGLPETTRGRRTSAGSRDADAPSIYRSDAFVLDIRLPARHRAVPPDAQARARTTRLGGGRPMRFIERDRAGRRGRDASASRSPPRTRCTSPTTSW